MRRDMVASFRYQSAPLLTFALGDLEMRKAFGAEIPLYHRSERTDSL